MATRVEEQELPPQQQKRVKEQKLMDAKARYSLDSLQKPGIRTIQGYIPYYHQNESTGSTSFIPKTHLQAKEVYVREGNEILEELIDPVLYIYNEYIPQS